MRATREDVTPGHQPGVFLRGFRVDLAFGQRTRKITTAKFFEEHCADRAGRAIFANTVKRCVQCDTVVDEKIELGMEP